MSQEQYNEAVELETEIQEDLVDFDFEEIARSEEIAQSEYGIYDAQLMQSLIRNR